MKNLFISKRFRISIVKGFLFGIGWENKEYVLFIGPFIFELDKKKPSNHF